MTLLPESLSAEILDSRNGVPAVSPTSLRIDPNRIEIKTLVQPLGATAESNQRHDQELADALNAGWEKLDLTVTTAETYTTALLHTRIVTLYRLVEAPEHSAAGAAGATVEVLAAAAPAETNGHEAHTPESWSPVPALPVDAPAPAPAIGLLLPVPTPVEPITYAEALLSGCYTPEAIREIAQREAAEAGIRAAWAQQQSRSGRTWESLLFQPPSVERVSVVS